MLHVLMLISIGCIIFIFYLPFFISNIISLLSIFVPDSPCLTFGKFQNYFVIAIVFII